MTAEREIDYEALAQDAMRGIVRTVLTRVAKSGLPGEHHFYIAFKTGAPGVVLSKRLKEKYPEEMTVVLQHRFWDLLVNDVRFEVKLTFDSIPERLVVPFAAIKVFFDPSVPYGLQFDEAEGEGAGPHHLSTVHGEIPRADAGAGERVKAPASPDGSRTEKKPRASRRPQSEKGMERPVAADKAPPAKQPAAKPSEPSPVAGPKVVSIDAFRKK
ncbi:MAG TPA: ClpXP protease specificity-enhancing factor SspB [Hyphomicrobiaceae bacterium]|jgi:hypothetical protein|nr:ClpXP protease specificity-enhancing factor SspB [Hyphomicrobiaceae bacterium]